MDAARWKHIKDLFDRAVELRPEARSRYLQTACESDEVRDEVESLLASHDTDPEFLEDNRSGDALLAVRQRGMQRADGESVGRYRLLREIGRGGMGTVYLAERADGAYDQHVAVKLVSDARLQESVAMRLRQERRILAKLQHPMIARLLDGGVTANGLPYIVMEYVEGIPLIEYCRENALTIPARLKLFEDVCSAVHYAHQNLVVHRDLKPSNILVSPTGQVKLLDFGIAKLQDEVEAGGEHLTRTGHNAMTPAYASPEQICGNSVSTASDVYSLGVILYEMLSGKTPYSLSGMSPSEMERTICDVDPARPSERVETDRDRRALQGDLDTITMMALRKEPSHRYESVAELAADVRRHVDHLPVLARPATIRYRATRFVRRNRVGAVAGVIVALALIGGTISTARQARIAAGERDRAEERSEQIHALASTMLGDLHQTIRDLPGTTPARRMLVAQATKYLDILASEATTDSLQGDLAESYTQLGEIQGDPHFPNLGDISQASESYKSALAIRERTWLQDTTDAQSTHEYARALGRLAVVNSWAGDNEQAIVQSQRALALLDQLPADDTVRRDIMRIQSELGWWFVWAGQNEYALRELKAARILGDELVASGPRDVDFMIDYWRILAYTSDALQFGGNAEEALGHLIGRGRDLTDSLSAVFPLNPRVQGILQTNHSKIARLFAIEGRHREALSAYEILLDKSRQAARADTADVRLLLAVGNIHHAMGDVHEAMGQADRAVAQYRSALGIRRRAFRRDTTNGEIGYVVASSLRELCRLLRLDGDLREALTACTESAQTQHAVVRADPQNLVGHEALKNSYLETARVELAFANRASGDKVRHLQASVVWFDRAVALLDSLRERKLPASWTNDYESIIEERATVASQLKP